MVSNLKVNGFYVYFITWKFKPILKLKYERIKFIFNILYFIIDNLCFIKYNTFNN